MDLPLMLDIARRMSRGRANKYRYSTAGYHWTWRRWWIDKIFSFLASNNRIQIWPLYLCHWSGSSNPKESIKLIRLLKIKNQTRRPINHWFCRANELSSRQSLRIIRLIPIWRIESTTGHFIERLEQIIITIQIYVFDLSSGLPSTSNLVRRGPFPFAVDKLLQYRWRRCCPTYYICRYASTLNHRETKSKWMNMKNWNSP